MLYNGSIGKIQKEQNGRKGVESQFLYNETASSNNETKFSRASPRSTNSTVYFFAPMIWFQSNRDQRPGYYTINQPPVITERRKPISSPSLPSLRLVSALSFHCHSLLVVGRLSAVVVVAVAIAAADAAAAAVATCIVVFSRAGRLCMPLKCGSLDAPNNPKPQQIILEYVGNYLCRSLGLAGVKRIIWWRAELFDVNQDNSTGQIIRTAHGGQTSGWLGRYVDSFIGEWGEIEIEIGRERKKRNKREGKKDREISIGGLNQSETDY